MWALDRIRVCVKELCRIQGRPYSPVSREEGLAALAAVAMCSVEEVAAMNPLLYVRQFLNDGNDDPIELLIKLCEMFGPFSYRAMATALVGHNIQLSTIVEGSEPSTPILTVSEPSLDASSAEIIEISDASSAEISESVSESIDTIKTECDISAIEIEPSVDIPEAAIVVAVVPTPELILEPSEIEVKSLGCGCFSWFRRRPK